MYNSGFRGANYWRIEKGHIHAVVQKKESYGRRVSEGGARRDCDIPITQEGKE
jgi:hypothetical protein